MKQIISILLAAVFLLCAAPFSAKTLFTVDYDELIVFQTFTDAGWKPNIDTKVSSAGNVTFTSSASHIGAEYPFSASWESFGRDTSEYLLLLEFNVSNAGLLKKSTGACIGGNFTLSGEKGSLVWTINDLPVSTGKNTLVLHFRTANTVIPEPALPEKTEETDGQTEKPDVTAEENTENEPTAEPENLPERPAFDEIIRNIREFSFDFIKIADQELTVSFTNISVAVQSSEEDEEKIEPITDEYSDTELKIGLIIGASVMIAIAVYCFLYAKKEAKRIRRELRRIRREKKMLEETEKNNEK